MSLNQGDNQLNFPYGLMFHRFYQKGDLQAGQGSITAEECEKILLYIGIENFLTPDEWMVKLKNNTLSKNDVVITYDDSLRSQYYISLPVLEKYNLKAFWFVYSSVIEGEGMGKFEIFNCFGTLYFGHIEEFFQIFLEKCKLGILEQLESDDFKNFLSVTMAMFPFYTVNDLKFRYIRNELLSVEKFEEINESIMADRGVSPEDVAEKLWISNEELKSLSDKGHNIGLHSYSHPMQLAKLSYEKQKEQYSKNYEHISSVCKKNPVAMAHPVNSYNNDTLKVLRGLDIECGFRSNTTPPVGQEINPNVLEMAREDPPNILRRLIKETEEVGVNS